MSWSVQMWGMVQAGDGARLALEPLAQIRLVSEMSRKDLDRDDSIEPRIAGAIHFAHSSRTDGGEDFVGP